MCSVPLQVSPPSLLLYTDASVASWGVCVLDLMAAGVSSREKVLLINILEMKAVVLAAQNTFLNRITGESVVLMSANTTVVAYLKKQRGTVSKVLCNLAQEVFLWTKARLIALTVSYIPGERNILVDQLSCPDQALPTALFLLPQVFGRDLRGL